MENKSSKMIEENDSTKNSIDKISNVSYEDPKKLYCSVFLPGGLFGIITDSIDAHKAFSQLEQSQGGLKGLDIVLLSDPTGEFCKLFQIYDESTHSAYPSYVIVDTELKVVFKTTFDPKIVNFVFNALKYLMNEESGQKDDKKVDTKADHTCPEG